MPSTSLARLPRGALIAAALAGCARSDAPRAPETASATGDPGAAGDPGAVATGCAAPAPPAGRVETILVSENARGMVTAVRWARSPDGCALLVVEDPVGVEAEPIPDAAIHAVSGAGGVAVTRVDSVWDVAPDSAWRRVAVGRAYVARGGEADTLPDSAWRALAAAVGRPERDVRAAAFPASAMTVAAAIARPAVWRLPAGATPRGRAADVVPLPLLAGWRVRWAPGDSTLLVGSGPARTGDDEPPRSWLRVDPRDGRPLGAAPSPPRLPPSAAWAEAPLLDVSTTVDLAASRTIPLAAGRVVGERGTVTLVDAAGASRTLGPGVPLATTADGRVVLAIAPRTGRVEDYQVRWRVVLYVVD